MSRNLSESMNSNLQESDSGADAIYNRMHQRRNQPQPTSQHKSAVALHFGENFEDYDDKHINPLGNDMRNVINSRRDKAVAEEEKMRRLGIEEYNRQTYGNAPLYKARLAYNADGDADADVMMEMRRVNLAGQQVSYNTPLDGKFETDDSFLIDGSYATHIDNGVNSGSIRGKQPGVSVSSARENPSSPLPTPASTKKSKEYNLKYNKKIEIPLADKLTKIRITVEYREDLAEDDRNALITLKKCSRGGNEKSIKVEVKGEGKVLAGESYMYFFEKRNDEFTSLTANLTGAGVLEASMICQ